MRKYSSTAKASLLNFQIQHGEEVISYTAPTTPIIEILPQMQRVMIAEQLTTTKRRVSVLQSFVVEHFPGALRRSKKATTSPDVPACQEVVMQLASTDIDDDLRSMISAAEESIETAVNLRNKKVDLTEVQLWTILADYDQRQEKRWADKVRKL